VTSISDANCKGEIGTSSTDVIIHPIPTGTLVPSLSLSLSLSPFSRLSIIQNAILTFFTARIEGGGVVCQGEESILKISLTGNA
jgi:hypothetical protein